MGMPEELPRFPCWCKATYSWGGESKKDLGFIEGDLIEALNAGDGSWWMGRLRRDPRAIGLFPSNFVTVLEESFTPAPNSRKGTPVTQQPKHNNSKSKSVFRKPYQAYEVLGAENSKENTPESEVEKKKEKSKFKPYSSMKTAQAPTGTIKRHNGVAVIPEDTGPRIPDPIPRYSAMRHARSPLSAQERPAQRPHASPTPTPVSGYPGYAPYRQPSPQHIDHAPARSRSPLPATYHDGSAYPQMMSTSRQASPAPYEYDDPAYHSRAPSPLPYEDVHQYSGAASPGGYENDLGSSPPPPPPAHRVAYQQSRAPSPELNEPMDPNYSRVGTQTPIPPSPNGSHMTPSPLRAAMNDVMSSLHDMSSFSQSPPPVTKEPSPPNVWSPEAFEEIRASTREQSRAQSSMGFASHHQLQEYGIADSHMPSIPSSRGGGGRVNTYVQRMEQQQLRHAKSFTDQAPQPPLKDAQYSSRPDTSSSGSSQSSNGRQQQQQLRHRKSAFDVAPRPRALDRTYTTKTNATNSTENSSATQSSTSTQLTSRSIMSGYSAGGFSATSAGSLARRKFGLGSQRERRAIGHAKSMGDINSSTRGVAESGSTASGISYHESHASFNQPLLTPVADWNKDPMENAGVLGGLGGLGGLSSPQGKRSGFFKRMVESAKTTARTGAANARSTIGSASGSRPGSRAGSRSPTKSLTNGLTAIAGGTASRSGAASVMSSRDMGLGGGGDWMQVRRDVNRSNSLSQRERDERAERCEMHDIPAMRPIDALHEYVEGDEGLDGLPVNEPTDFQLPNLQLVDKSTRFIHSIPPMTSPSSLAQSYVCRPHRSDVQRLRAIFTWVAERITWEEDYEGQTDTRRAIQTKRACSEEIALLVHDMCTAVGLHAEVVRGYLKGPGEVLDLDTIARPNHWWNAVIVDGEWRMMDCALANPTHPRRTAYSTASSQVAESWYFLARPMELCYTHIPLLPEQQHIVPSIEHEVLISLPCACPSYFRNGVELANFDTSILHLQNLEMAHLHIHVPEDIEIVAMTESRAFAQDADGDFFESGDITTKKAFAQPEWTGGRKRFTIKALLPGDEGQGTLKIYAGKRGLMHSIKDNPHALALAMPLTHSGQNPPYEFLTRHPTPHAQRHDLYVAQPQCAKLTLNNTFVFCVRQHPSSLSRFTPDTWGTSANGRPQSPNPLIRPSSAMSMVSMTASNQGSNYGSESSDPMTAAQQKPAKLAIQSPSQKIVRLTRKQDNVTRNVEEDMGLTTVWETVIKIGEKGTWRGLVLADRSARWCVFAEWECA